nr:hypothetical protein [Tanacetum cinerariifolium]
MVMYPGVILSVTGCSHGMACVNISYALVTYHFFQTRTTKSWRRNACICSSDYVARQATIYWYTLVSYNHKPTLLVNLSFSQGFSSQIPNGTHQSYPTMGRSFGCYEPGSEFGYGFLVYRKDSRTPGISNIIPPRIHTSTVNCQLPGQQQMLQLVHQLASPLARMLPQPQNTLQLIYPSSQQAFSPLQPPPNLGEGMHASVPPTMWQGRLPSTGIP